MPADIKMREMVQGGELGELRRVNWIITNWFRTQQYYDQGGWLSWRCARVKRASTEEKPKRTRRRAPS